MLMIDKTFKCVIFNPNLENNYNQKILNKSLVKLANYIKSGGNMLGRFNPQYTAIDANVNTIKIVDLYKNNDKCWICEFKTLNTTKGKIVKSLLMYGLKMRLDIIGNMINNDYTVSYIDIRLYGTNEYKAGYNICQNLM